MKKQLFADYGVVQWFLCGLALLDLLAAAIAVALRQDCKPWLMAAAVCCICLDISLLNKKAATVATDLLELRLFMEHQRAWSKNIDIALANQEHELGVLTRLSAEQTAQNNQNGQAVTDTPQEAPTGTGTHFRLPSEVVVKSGAEVTPTPTVSSSDTPSQARVEPVGPFAAHPVAPGSSSPG